MTHASVLERGSTEVENFQKRIMKGRDTEDSQHPPLTLGAPCTGSLPRIDKVHMPQAAARGSHTAKAVELLMSCWLSNSACRK